MREGKIRVQFDRALIFAFRVSPLPLIRHEVRDRVVRVGERIVEIERALRRLFCFGQILPGVEKSAVDEAPVDVRQIRIRERVVRVRPDRLDEVFGSLPAILRTSPGPMRMPLEQQLVRDRVQDVGGLGGLAPA